MQVGNSCCICPQPLLNKINDDEITVEIIDLTNGLVDAAGTEVVVKIPV